MEEARKIIEDLEQELARYRNDGVESTIFTKFPPPSLAWRVGGADPTGKIYPDFIVSGLQVVHNLLARLRPLGKTSGDFKRVLDFGCGCGRVTRFLAYERFTGELMGCDVDPEAIAWSQANIPHAQFLVTPYTPPLPFPDNHFDLIYGISIFTHLNEADQFAWLKELGRIVTPDGILILTVQGRNRNWQRLPDDVKAKLERDGIWYDESNIYFEKANTYGFEFPETFKLTYHTVKYVEHHWSQYFEVLDIAERAISHDQDAVVLRRKR